jgi:excisionase family DNA binding protein
VRQNAQNATTVCAVPRDPSEFVTTPEAARLLNVGVRSLQRWVASGEIEPDWRTPGGHARWDVERLRAELRNPSRFRRDQ